MTTSIGPCRLDGSWTIHLPSSELAEEVHCDIQQIIKTNYTVFAANVDSLADAQVICFGEDHDNPEHKKNSAAIIDALCKQNDVLLVEGKLPDEPMQHSEYQKKPIEIRSWDVPSSEKNIEETSAFVLAEMRMENPSCPTCLNLAHRDFKKASCCTIACLICVVLCDSICSKIFSSCIRKYYKRQYLGGLQKIVADSPVRNQFMRQNIEAVVSQGKRVFVNAGSAHLRPVSTKDRNRVKGIDYTASNESVEETLDYLKTKKFMVLIPKIIE